MTIGKKNSTAGKSRYSHGDLICVNLGFGTGMYTVCKYIDLRKINLDNHAYQLLLVYNCFRTDPVFDLSKLSHRELLCNPLRFFGPNYLPGNWCKIGKEDVAGDEYINMQLKSWGPHSLDSKDSIPKVEWYCGSAFDINESKKCDYDEVRHLEANTVIYIEKITFRIYLEYLKLNEAEVQNFHPNYREVFLNSFDIPRLKDIPVMFRWKRCKEGISSKIGSLPIYKSFIPIDNSEN